MKTEIKYLKNFAEKLGCVFVEKGEVGFGRPCVGILDPVVECYLDINPFDFNKETVTGDYEDCYFFDYDENLNAPDNVPDAYHKHSCMAVLVHNENYDEAIKQLYKWAKHIESFGKVVFKKHSEKNMEELDEVSRIFSSPYLPAIILEKE